MIINLSAIKIGFDKTGCLQSCCVIT